MEMKHSREKANNDAEYNASRIDVHDWTLESVRLAALSNIWSHEVELTLISW